MNEGTEHNPPPPPGAPPPPPYGAPPMQGGPGGRLVDPNATADDRTFALFIHLTLLGHLVVSFFAIIATIIMWQVKKDQSAFIDDHGKEAVNFQLSLIIYSIIAIPLAIITCGIGAVLFVLVYVLGLVGMILAAVAANRGEYYRYPMTIRFLK